MFIQTQDRKSIINTFAVKKFVVTEDNQIQAVIELPTKTKPAVIEVLGQYDSDEKRKAVVKGLMYDMRRREQAFKMPKNHKVSLFPLVGKQKKAAKTDAAQADAAQTDAAQAENAPTDEAQAENAPTEAVEVTAIPVETKE